MLRYPLLSIQQSQKLPALIANPQLIPPKFTDSTHHIWHCETIDGPMVLKVCNTRSIEKSNFWFVLNELFGANFPLSLGQASASFQLLEKYGEFIIPGYISSGDNGYVLTKFIPGLDLSHVDVNDDAVISLAQHLSNLHQKTYTHWGALAYPELPADKWGARLAAILVKLTQSSDISIENSLIEEVLVQAQSMNVTRFVPIMPDLRWDQIRRVEGGGLVLIDLDAIVIGPQALELVLLEYLLDEKQHALFQKTYSEVLTWPNYENEKKPYQLLLFLMGVLGENDLEKWMRH